MQTTSLNGIRKTLLSLETGELTDLCLRLARYKKENKELLSYLLYEAGDEARYVEEICREIDAQFDTLPYSGAYKYAKQIRKILRYVGKYSKYSSKPETGVELLLHFCRAMKSSVAARYRSTVLDNLYFRQIEKVEKAMEKLHEDLRYDFVHSLEELRNW